MLYKVAFLFAIGLIASCAADESQPAAADAVPATIVEAVPAVVVEAVPEKVVEVVAPVGGNVPAAVEAAPEPPKACGTVKNNNNKPVVDQAAVSCRGPKGSRKCRDVCGTLGFKLASCKTTSYKPKAIDASCVCSNDGKYGLVVTEYEGPPSVRKIPGYYKRFFPMRAACNDCACDKVCQNYRMSPDDKGLSVYTKGFCVDRSCYCLKAFHSEKEEKLAKRHLNRPQNKL